MDSLRDQPSAPQSQKQTLQLPSPVYRADKLLGFGAQGKVYAATLLQEGSSPTACSEIANTSVNESPNSNRRVALKLYNTEEHEDSAQMALEEFKVLSSVQGHANVVKVLDFKHESGQFQLPNCLPKSPDDHFYQFRQGTTLVKEATYLTMELTQFGDLFDFV